MPYTITKHFNKTNILLILIPVLFHSPDSLGHSPDLSIAEFIVKRPDFLHERLKPEVTFVYQDDNQGRIIPKVIFELKDNLWLKLGYAHFFGHSDTNNGQFSNKDQLMFEVKYTY